MNKADHVGDLRTVALLPVVRTRLLLVLPSMILGWGLSSAFNPWAARATLCRQLSLSSESCAGWAVVLSLFTIIILTGVAAYCLARLVSRLPALQAFRVRAVLGGLEFEGAIVAFDIFATVLYRLWVSNEEFSLGFGFWLLIATLVAGLYVLTYDVVGEWSYRSR